LFFALSSLKTKTANCKLPTDLLLLTIFALPKEKTLSNLRETIAGLSSQILQRIVDLRRELHQNPELSFEEFQTSNLIAKKLTRIGITTYSGIAETGVIGLIEGKKPGKTIGIRAELDALPIEEKTGLPFSSMNKGVMHACGHDIHMANLVGTAMLLNQLRNEIEGNILLIFQPGEELLPGGAKRIIESDVFQQNKPDIMLGLHIQPDLPFGVAGFRPGPYMASGDEIYLTIKGKGGHAALPNTYVNPIAIASEIVVALQQEVTPPKETNIPSVLAFGKFIGNGATNIIPSEVKIEGTFRTLNESWRTEAHSQIQRISSRIAEIAKAKCEVEIRNGYPSILNNEELTTKAVKFAEEFLGKDKVAKLPLRMTTDDFAYFSALVPSTYFRIGTMVGNESFSLHSENLNVNDSILSTSIGLTTWLIVKILSNH